MNVEAAFDLAEVILESGKTSDVARAAITLRSTIAPLFTSGFSFTKLAAALPSAVSQGKPQADAVCSVVQVGYALAVDPTYGTPFREALKGLDTKTT